MNSPTTQAPVALARGGSPSQMALGAMQEALDPAAFAGKKVLVKPNCCFAAAPGSGVVTHAETVRGVIQFLRQAGAASIRLGDGAIWGLDTDQALEASGLAQVAREEGVELINLDQGQPITLETPSPLAVERMKISSLALEADAIVSVPVIKCHMHAVVSLGIKNMKGCLHGRQKRDFHHLRDREGQDTSQGYRNIDRAIADLFSVLPPFAVVADGVVGLEGLGPLLGTPKPLGLVLAGGDPLSVEAATLGIMGFEPQEAPHLMLAAMKSGRELLPWTELNLDQEAFARAISPFKRAQAPDLAGRYPQFKVVEGNVCSACPATVSAFLLTQGEQFAGRERPICIALGREVDPAQLEGPTVLLGNCTAKLKKRGSFIEGCPPVPSDLLQAIKELD